MSDELGELLRLEPHGPDTWVGSGPIYPWGRVYGGQVVAQALRAAAHTVRSDVAVHSLHSYFIRPGTNAEPIRYEVDRLRDGRSFETRRVVARQSAGAILTLAASYQVTEDGEVALPTPVPDAPAPAECADHTWSSLFEHRQADLGTRPGRALSWMRSSTAVGDDPVANAAALAFMSDDLPMEAIAAASEAHPPPAVAPDPSPGSGLDGAADGVTGGDDVDGGGGGGFDEVWMGASLDHAVWFHEPVRAERWHLFDLRAQRLGGARGLATGHVFDETGLHVATLAQEGLLRRRR